MGQDLDPYDDMVAQFEAFGIADSPSYVELVQTFASVLLAVDGNDVTGDTQMLLDDGQRFGFLYFGWGSCSWCDAMYAAHGCIPELMRLRVDLAAKTVWCDSARDLAYYLATKDWALDFDADGAATEAFVVRTLEILAATRR